MVDVKAKLNYYRIAPRKARLVADLIRGKRVDEALIQIAFLKKKSSPAIAKLLKSAISNAKHNYKMEAGNANLYIKEIRVDEGPAHKRYRRIWHGMAHPFKRRTSHITVVLAEQKK